MIRWADFYVFYISVKFKVNWFTLRGTKFKVNVGIIIR